jgi:hypothetical protein
LSTTFCISQGLKNWPFLDVDRFALRASREDEIGLSAQKRGRLQHIDHLGHLRERRVLVDVGEHGDTDLLAHARERQEALLEPGSAKALARGAIGLVEGGLEYERNAESLGDVAQPPRHIDHQRLALDDARPGDQKERPIGADLERGELHAVARAGWSDAR